jgi:phosphatidylserine/phosphatidylglycerophosphate/cardiolipin synthase-like enzyme
MEDVEREHHAEEEKDTGAPRRRVADVVAVGMEEDRDRGATCQRPRDQELGGRQVHRANLTGRAFRVRGYALEMHGLLARFDDAVGNATERAVLAQHRRRLQKQGWLNALDAGPGGWATGDPPPREGNSLEILIDGAEALPRLAEALESAQSHVHLAGWHFSPEFALRRDGKPAILRNILAELAERIDVRVLMWAGAPLPLFRPARREVRAVRDALAARTKVSCALDSRERPLHCHHEKIAVVDGRLAFVGGIDLSLLGGDRFDSSSHPARAAVGWHDASALVTGPAVAGVAEHFSLRWHEVTGETLPSADPPAETGDVKLQIVRTVPNGLYESLPHGDFRIAESYLRALRSAERLVHLESQFLWSPEITGVLAEKLERPPSDNFRLLVILPARPNNGKEDTRGALADLVEADGGAGRFLACTLYARRGPVADPVYVHAKIGIVDDRWITIGSANLNEHSLFNDSEMNVVSHDPVLARATRLRLWAEHLERTEDEVSGDPAELIDSLWRPLAEEQLDRRRRGEPLEHRLVRLPHLARKSNRLLGPINGLLVDG